MSDMTIDPNAHMPIGTAQADPNAQVDGGSNDGKVKDKATTAASVLATMIQEAVTVTTMTRTQGQQTTGVNARKDVPRLGASEDPKALLQDLEKVIAFLQMDNDQHQAELARKRIEGQQGAMDTVHADRLKKIDDSIKAALKAEKAAKANRVLGILGAVLAVVTAIVVTAVTGGLAAGLAWAGAAIAVTQVALDLTHTDEKIINAMGKSMEKTFGLSPAKAKAWASGIYSACFAVAGLIAGGVGIYAGFKAVKLAVDTISLVARFAMFGTQTLGVALGLSGAITGAVQTAYGKDAADAEVKLKETNRCLAMLQQMLDESKDELQQVMDQLQSLFGQLVAIIQSKTDTGNMIMQNLTHMI